MKYISPLIAVTDMECSKAFYKKYLGLDVEVDFGANVTLTGGLSLQTLDTWREFIDGAEVSFRSNAGELYFEEDDFDEFLMTLDGVEFVHPVKEHSWGQRAIRLYDPDGHIIEVGENIAAVARHFADMGMTEKEVATRMDVREEYVREWLAPGADMAINELTEAHRALQSTLQKCEKIDTSRLGKSQQTLLERRTAALKLALTLIEKEQKKS